MSFRRNLACAAAGIAILAVGFTLGVMKARDVESFLPTARFVDDRMHECRLTLRLHDHAQATGDETLERLVMGDLSGCGVLVALHPDSIPDKHAETAERIRAAVGDRFAAR